MAKWITIIVLISLILTGCAVSTPEPTTSATMTNTPLSTLEPTTTATLTNTPLPTSIPAPSPTPAEEFFVTYIRNLYTYVHENNKGNELPLRSIGFVENPDGDVTLLVQVKGDVSEASKGATLGTLSAVISKELNESPNKTPERLRLFVIEFFDSNDNYFTNLGVEWPKLRDLISKDFGADDLRRVVRVDVTGYKK